MAQKKKRLSKKQREAVREAVCDVSCVRDGVMKEMVANVTKLAEKEGIDVLQAIRVARRKVMKMFDYQVAIALEVRVQ